MDPLPFDAYALAAPLFSPLDFHLAVPAALEGRTPGVLYANHPDRPSSAVLWVSHTFFLAGAPDDEDFNQALARLFAQEIFPARSQNSFVFTWVDPGWQSSLEQVILPGHLPIPLARQYYALDVDPLNGSAEAIEPPAGYRLAPVDLALTCDRRLSNMDDLLEELCSERPTVEAFLENSFGTCLLAEDYVAAWCLSEYNLGARCEVGIATHPVDRNRGLATLTGRAFIEQARAAGVQRIGWHCWTGNTGSARTALKLGFHLDQDYPACLVLADPVANLALHGEFRLKAGAFAEAAAWFERAFRLGEGPDWAYIDAACTYAELGDRQTALRCLAQAAEKGFEDFTRLETNPHLLSLQGTPEWAELKQKRTTRLA